MLEHCKPSRMLMIAAFAKQSVTAQAYRMDCRCCHWDWFGYSDSTVQVLLDGVPLTELDAGWYRSQIGVVAQDPRLFSNTIAANITYGCPGKSQVCIALPVFTCI